MDWRPFLEAYSQELLKNDGIRSSVPDEVLASRWMGYPGASEDQIAEREKKLGIRLPPSYREFLKVSNGWRHPGFFVYELYPVEKTDWFRARNQSWIRAYTFFRPLFLRRPSIPDHEYFMYGSKQDPARFRAEYLHNTLEISSEGDSAIYLLNPEVVFPDGEWESWFFANWLPGASRYRSFGEMMRAEREDFLKA